jgi:hypothetical protein
MEWRQQHAETVRKAQSLELELQAWFKHALRSNDVRWAVNGTRPHFAGNNADLLNQVYANKVRELNSLKKKADILEHKTFPQRKFAQAKKLLHEAADDLWRPWPDEGLARKKRQEAAKMLEGVVVLTRVHVGPVLPKNLHTFAARRSLAHSFLGQVVGKDLASLVINYLPNHKPGCYHALDSLSLKCDCAFTEFGKFELSVSDKRLFAVNRLTIDDAYVQKQEAASAREMRRNTFSPFGPRVWDHRAWETAGV